MLVAALSKTLLKLLHWKIEPFPCVKRGVVILAPHTSNWDFFYSFLYVSALGIRMKILMKHELFRFPTGFLFRLAGGIPVDRSRPGNLVNRMDELFYRRKHFIVGLSPEGSRKRVETWKTGFYYMALSAKVPILAAYIDYSTRQIGVLKSIVPSGDVITDMESIRALYRTITPKHPERFEAVPMQSKASNQADLNLQLADSL